MAIAGWIRESLDRAEHWREALDLVRSELAAMPAAPTKIDRTLDVAEASEHVDPDRSKALALFLAAFRDGHMAARGRVLALAAELRAHVTLAEVALSDHGTTNDPESLVAAARSFVDAGLLERAIEMYVDAAKQHASLAEMMMTAPRLADMKYALARAHHRKLDANAEVDACLARVAQDGAPAALLAARIARLAQLPRYASLVASGARAHPQDPELGRLVEDAVMNGSDADGLLAFHSGRLETARGEEAWIELARAAGFELMLRNVYPGLGQRMLRTSIEHAYAARLPVSRHIAAWELLAAAARETRSTVALLPLLARGLDAPLPIEDTIYVARLGLEIAWRDGRDPVAAQPFAARLRELVPAHPLATAFFAEHVTNEPVAPTVTFKIPKIAPPAAAPSPAPAAPPSSPPAAPASPPPAASASSTTYSFRRPDAAVMRAERKIVPLDVVVELPSGGFFSAVLRDVSATGAFIPTKRALAVGTVVALEIRTPVARGAQHTSHRTDAKVARHDELGCGLQFVNPPRELVTAIEVLLG